MIEIAITEDINKFEPTLIGPFTTRKTICGLAMAAVVYGTYMLEKAAGINDPLTRPFFIIPGLIPFLFGWWKPYGLKLEQFLGTAIRDNFIAPTKRKYVSELSEQAKEAKKKKEKTKKKKDNNKEKEKKEKAIPRNQLPQELRSYK